MPQLRYNQLANPHTAVVVGSFTIPNDYSWATFVNTGTTNDALIDFGNGQTIPLGPKESISMPFCGRPYAATTVDAASGGGTTVKVVYLP